MHKILRFFDCRKPPASHESFPAIPIAEFESTGPDNSLPTIIDHSGLLAGAFVARSPYHCSGISPDGVSYLDI
jgi:hypothetical protein